MVLWTTSGVFETANVSNTSLNSIFVNLTYYHLSNLMKVEQVLMVTIKPLSHHFSFSKERHKRLLKKSRKKQAAKTFSFGSLIFSSFQFSFKCLHFLFWNSFLESLWSFYAFAETFYAFLTFIVSNTSSVYRYTAFPAAMRKVCNSISEILGHLRFSFGLAYLTTTIQL